MRQVGRAVSFLALALVLAGAAVAARITAYEPAVDQIRFQGQISAVRAGHDSFVVMEREVCLVDFSHDGRLYQTSILRLDGTPLSPEDLKPGDWVAVKGSLLGDQRVGARVIYLLPHKLSRAEALTYPVLVQDLDWGSPSATP